jgi:hypothetical protein
MHMIWRGYHCCVHLCFAATSCCFALFSCSANALVRTVLNDHGGLICYCCVNLWSAVQFCSVLLLFKRLLCCCCCCIAFAIGLEVLYCCCCCYTYGGCPDVQLSSDWQISYWYSSSPASGWYSIWLLQNAYSLGSSYWAIVYLRTLHLDCGVV